MNTLYTVEEVAEILKINKQTVMRYIKAGNMKAIKIGRYWRITEEDFQSFLDHATKETEKALELLEVDPEEEETEC